MFLDYKPESEELFKERSLGTNENTFQSPTFNIENSFSLLISKIKNHAANSAVDIVRDIFAYYSNPYFSHNYDIILSNKEIIPSLIALSTIGTDDEKQLSFKIINLLLQKNEFIAIAFVQNDLLNVVSTIPLNSNPKNFSIFVMISQIFKQIVKYTSKEILDPLFQSHIPSLMISLLTESTSMRLSDLENEYVYDKFMIKNKYTQSMNEKKLRKKYLCLKYERQTELYNQACYEEIILNTIEYIYSYCGCMAKENTERIIKACLLLMSSANKSYLCDSISKCLSKMIAASSFACKTSLHMGLISFLNSCMKSTQHEMAFLSILNVDLAVIQCLKKEMSNEKYDSDVLFEIQTTCDAFFDLVNPNILYDIIMYSNRTINNTTYLQMIISKAFELLSITIDLKPVCLVADRSSKFVVPEHCLDFSQILEILSLLKPDECEAILKEQGTIFDLQMNAVVSILTIINCSICIDSNPDFVNELFGQFGPNIIDILDNCNEDITLMALNLLNKLLNKIAENLNGEKSMQNFFIFFTNEDFQMVLSAFQESDNETIRDLANIIFEACSKM